MFDRQSDKEYQAGYQSVLAEIWPASSIHNDMNGASQFWRRSAEWSVADR